MDAVEKQVLEAAVAEGLAPSTENLPQSGEIVQRRRSDSNTGSRINEFFGTESYIKQMSRPGRRLLRLMDPRSGRVLIGPNFDQAR